MKKIIILMLVAGLFSCQSNTQPEVAVKDSIAVAKDIKNTVILDDLLTVKNEAELIAAFGKENVLYDTIWGSEGMFTMGTILFPETEKEVQIIWEDSVNNSGIISLEISAMYQEGYIYKSYWKTKDGISIGTTLKEIEKINGTAFNFLGVGWDYGGNVTSFQGGKLDSANLGITLDAVLDEKMDEDAYGKISGDVELSSNSSDVAVFTFKVIHLFLFVARN